MKVKRLLVQVFDNYRENKRKNANFEMLRKRVNKYLVDLPQPELTDKEKREIDDYWRAYGIKFRDYGWFQWYYGITGIKSPRFIPSEVYFYMIMPFYNTKKYVLAWKDKNMFNRFLPKVNFPDTVIKKINGLFYDKYENYIGNGVSDELLKMLIEAKQVIVKSTYDTGCGKTVTKYDIESLSDAEKILREWDDDNYIIQKVIKQHDFFARFNSSSVNVMRINSWYRDGKVEIVSPVLRFGMPGYVTDVCFIDGKEIVRLVGITSEGYLRKDVVTFDGKKQKLSEVVDHVDERVPAWDDIVELIKTNAPKLEFFSIVGWDITVSEEDGKPVVMEYNINGPSPYSSQMTDGPMFGEHTEEVLSFLKDKKNQEKFIPKWMRAN